MADKSQIIVNGSGRPSDLPDFVRPPVIEVVLGVQFSELTNYRTWHAGLLWDSVFRTSFPKCVEQPPLDLTFETFGSNKQQREFLKIQQMLGPIVPRLWFVNQEQSQLVQFQSSRLLHNWRRHQQDAEYPRYEHIRERFFSELHSVSEFTQNQSIGPLEINQCEVSYINHINLPDGSDPHRQLDRIFNLTLSASNVATATSTTSIILEDRRFALRFIIVSSDSGGPLGRLHVVAEPAVETNDKPIIRLTLTARGNPISPSHQGIGDFLDIGRETIVRTFTSITTDEMHLMWERLK